MQQSAPAPSSSTSGTGGTGGTGGARREFRAVTGSLRAKSLDRFQGVGVGGYFLTWMLIPVFELVITGLIYADRPELMRYAVVSIAASSLVFTAVYFAGEILDRERLAGTLAALFLAPCSRYSWLGGFQLVGLVEAFLIATVAIVFGRYAYDVQFDPNYVSLLVSLLLLLAVLWGMSMIFGAIGLLLKKANQFSNVVYPIAMLFGGIYYPVALLPDWARIPARALPLGYGFQALADAALRHASLRDITSDIVPLAGFAVVLPLLGMLAFRWLEIVVRKRGELDLY